MVGVCLHGERDRNGGVCAVPEGLEGFLHAYNGLHAFINVFRIEPTDPDQIIADLLFLEMQLLGVGECLQLAAAALSVVCTFRFHTKRRRL